MIVSELAERVGVDGEVVRYYSRLGLLKPSKRQNGYRQYSERDLQHLQFIQKAKKLGFTLKEIRMILHDVDTGHSPCQRVRDILESRLQETRQKVTELMALQQRMEHASTLWQSIPDGIPGDESICILIERAHDL